MQDLRLDREPSAPFTVRAGFTNADARTSTDSATKAAAYKSTSTNVTDTPSTVIQHLSRTGTSTYTNTSPQAAVAPLPTTASAPSTVIAASPGDSSASTAPHAQPEVVERFEELIVRVRERILRRYRAWEELNEEETLVWRDEFAERVIKRLRELLGEEEGEEWQWEWAV